ncbi:NAD(P)-dependent oxidoreductase [Methylobacterium sp. E-016]|uniref:NAD-dependent epimerase/dehydratase family protein n=1 Tax=Methylobacterium sp. E-016 TaxID=2836556 RepID=UPI001FBA2F4B|nr:NAD(P)-dependent oxidoreductase [Methylobacterium sp. E-016]MCJ2078268.1 NAD(P)-dependent oxidoreductase [Methylobacterium sp. E-016]
MLDRIGPMHHLPRADIDEVLRRNSVDWSRLVDARIFITGGTGFFGRWLIAVLSAADAAFALNLKITLLTRNVASAQRRIPGHEKVSWLEGDVRSFPLPPGQFDYLIHAATDSSQAGQRDPDGLTAQVVNGTRRVIDFARQAGVHRCLYVSSGAVYGRQPSQLEAMAETCPCRPSTGASAVYGQAKLAAEDLMLAAGRHHDLNAVVARPFACVGPGLPLDTHFAIGNFIRDALRGGDVVVASDGRPLRSYLYAADLADWLLTLLVRGDAGQVYNVGSDRAISIADLAGLVSSLVSPTGRIVIESPVVGGSSAHRYIPSIEKARLGLGLDAWTSLESAICKTVDDARLRGAF